VDAEQPFELDEPFSWRRTPLVLADRLGVRPASVIAGLVAVVAAGAGGWWALRPPPPPAEDVLPLVTEVPPVTSPPSSSPLVLVVHVDGAVERPGVHDVAAGGRVIDAVLAAGGLSRNADRSRINLAQPVADGQRIWVPAMGEGAPPAIVGGGQPAASGDEPATGPAGPLSLSTASAAALEALPGIGPSLAAAIVEHRDRNGAFEEVADLLDVAGIGPAKLEAIADLVQP